MAPPVGAGLRHHRRAFESQERWPAACLADGVEPTIEQQQGPADTTEWSVLGRRELMDAFLDEPEALILLND